MRQTEGSHLAPYLVKYSYIIYKKLKRIDKVDKIKTLNIKY